jgi:hypothetical protein
MNELKQKMQNAIANNFGNADAADKCAAIAKEYTLKVLDNLSHFKDKDGDRVYINIIKARMAVQTGDI